MNVPDERNAHEQLPLLFTIFKYIFRIFVSVVARLHANLGLPSVSYIFTRHFWNVGESKQQLYWSV